MKNKNNNKSTHPTGLSMVYPSYTKEVQQQRGIHWLYWIQHKKENYVEKSTHPTDRSLHCCGAKIIYFWLRLHLYPLFGLQLQQYIAT